MQQKSVLWIDLDNGTRRTDVRFDALGKARDVAPDAPLTYISMPVPWLDASDESLMHQVTELVLYLGAKLVVIDNLGLISASVDENDAKMAGVMSNLKRLGEVTGAAVLVIHHQRKNTGSKARKGETLRGHSSIEASLDLALHVERKDGTDDIVVTPTKLRDATSEPFGALFTYDHHLGTKELAGAKFFRKEYDPDRNKALDKAIVDSIEDQGPTGVLNQRQLVKGVLERLTDSKVGVNAVRERIEELAEEGTICKSQGKGTAIWYRLP